MTTDTIYCVDYTTMDHYSAEKEFNGPDALRNACVFAQGIEEDGGSAHVTDQEGNEVDHWDGYQVSLAPNGTSDSVNLVLVGISETAIKLAWNDELLQHILIRENFKWN